jgi:hypothetical protein
MNRTLSLDDYLSLANTALQLQTDGQLRTARKEDGSGIQDLTHLIGGLEYPLPGINAILTEPGNLNYVIAQTQKPTPKDREPGGSGYPSLLSFSLAYPAQQFPKILGYMTWIPSEIPPEHNDPHALWLELKITHPNMQGKGVYRIIRTMQELAAYEKGYQRIYLQSFNDKARDIHLKEGYNLLRCVQLSEPGQPDHDEYLMRLDLTAERHQRNKEYFKVPTSSPTTYHNYPLPISRI